MAHTSTKEVPSKRTSKREGQFLPEFQFDADKKYMFQLAEENPTRELPVWDMHTNRPATHKKYKPSQNIVLTSQIVWEGERRTIRYYDGCTTLFVDEQPKERETIDQLIRQSRQRNFEDGVFGVFGDERLLLIYLSICSWNAESEFRTRTADGIFIPVNKDKKATAESAKLDLIEEAMGLAREASATKMKIHANYLGISDIDFDSGNPLTDKEIRTEYRKKAQEEPKSFIDSYGNQAIETKYYIDKALEQGLVHNSINPNKAYWKSGTEICDISGLKSNEAISEKLLEFSQLEEGEEFKTQLRAIFN